MPINPIIGSALLGVGSSVLSGLFGGKAKSDDRKYQAQQRQQMLGQLRPKGNYYASPYLPGLDKIMTMAILGNLGQQFGSDTLSQWGIDPTTFSNLPMLQNKYFSQYTQGTPYGRGLSRPMNPGTMAR